MTLAHKPQTIPQLPRFIVRAQNMALSANEIRQELFTRINQAQVHHDLLSGFRDCTAEEGNLTKFNRNVRFFSGVESALFNSAIVLLYTLYETRPDTINFYQFLSRLSGSVSPEDLESYANRILEIKPVWIRVGILRNEMVGHQTLDRSRAAVESKAKVSVSQVESLLVHARQLLFDISCRHFDTHLDYMSNSHKAVGQLLSRVAL